MNVAQAIVAALAGGVLNAMGPTAEQAVKDAYAAVKSYLTKKYAAVDLAPLESKPDSQPKRDSLAEDLIAVHADSDEELTHLVQMLIAALKSSPNKVIGAELIDIAARNLTIRNVKSTGDGIHVRGANISKDMTVDGVEAGERREASPFFGQNTPEARPPN